jgi:hypothetical protein
MKSTDTTPFDAQNAVETVTIRMAVSADAAALSRLAQLDSARPPASTRILVAEVGGELRAALPLDGPPAIADPFQRTASLVTMLVERARLVEPPARRRAWSLPLLRTARAATVPRA